MSKVNVIKLARGLQPKYNGGTPAQRLARERNWCCRIINCMIGLTIWMYDKRRISQHTYSGLIRALNTAKYNLDTMYYHDLDKIRAKERRQ